MGPTQLGEQCPSVADEPAVDEPAAPPAAEFTGARPEIVSDDELALDPSDDALYWWAGLFMALNAAGLAVLLIILVLWFTVGPFR